MNKNVLQALYIVGVGVVFFLFFYFKLNLYFSMANIKLLKNVFLDFGYLAPLYLILIFIVLNITGIPRVFITIFSGYVYGVVNGFLYSWIATMIGLIVTFIMVRYLFRQSFERRFGSKKVVEKINTQIDQYGIWIVVLLRVIYVVPSSILNYSFGFTKIKTSSYFYGSAIGFVPVVFFNVWAGNALAEGFIQESGNDFRFIILGVAALGLIFLFKYGYKKFWQITTP